MLVQTQTAFSQYKTQVLEAHANYSISSSAFTWHKSTKKLTTNFHDHEHQITSLSIALIISAILR